MATVSSIPLRGSSAREPAVAHLIPTAGKARDLFGGGFVILVVTPLSAEGPPEAALIQGLFDLTAAEARVAAAVVQGLSIATMASNRGVTTETIRSQLKSVLAKTGTHRQAELAAKLRPVRSLQRDADA